MTFLPSCLAFFLLFSSAFISAQDKRFHKEYPLALPSDDKSELSYEIQRTVSAMLGGVKLASLETTPKKQEDPEAFTKDDIKNSLQEMLDYVAELSAKLQIENSAQLKKIGALIKGGKYDDATQKLKLLGAKSDGDIEAQFFVWKEYMSDIKNKAPWIDPANIKISRIYREMLTYVAKVYERPYGVQAEPGAILADAAQALSNCLEHPNDIAWHGETKIKMTEKDELKRLASNVAYFNWKMHDKVSGRRAALINTEVVRHLHHALYHVVHTIIKNHETWNMDAGHSKNLAQLYKDVQNNGWYVNGDKARKKSK